MPTIAGAGVDSAWEQNAKRLEATLREMLAADWASELPANIAQPERVSAGHSPASSTYHPGARAGRGVGQFLTLRLFIC